MATTGLKGPWPFTSQEIDLRVRSKFPGNYALGYKNDTGAFVVKYVGRSDVDLGVELKQRLPLGHKLFKGLQAPSAVDAYQRECANYHDFGGSAKLDNKIHPARPANSTVTCPVSGCNL